MQLPSAVPVRRLGVEAAGEGLLAAVLSAAVLMWRGRADAGSAAAPLNAISHWFWPRRALRRNEVSLQHTATGAAIHVASSVFWAALYSAARHLRRRPTAVNAITDAAALTTVAAVVDFKLVPERLAPGFEQRLERDSLVLVYAAFALGLALAGIGVLRR